MPPANFSAVNIETRAINSLRLEREVQVDLFLPRHVKSLAETSLLLINDGHNMEEMGLGSILQRLHTGGSIAPLSCIAIHTGIHRKMEYGVSSQADYLGRGARAFDYSSFITAELLPFLKNEYGTEQFRERAFAGFSLGALMALDIVWNRPDLFSKAGLFSGSFWWRSVDQSEPHYDDDLHRIIHQEIRKGTFNPGLKFFFQCGLLDETMDRNNNGIIDSIDDTLDLVGELVQKGYDRDNDICYYEMEDGRHDIDTWARAMPVFLKWGWGIK
jgi:enterochelin esterase-like enzyme